MAKVTKLEKLQRISNANALLAECGYIQYIKGDWSQYARTETLYFNWAFKLWWSWLKKENIRKKYKKEHQDYLKSPLWQITRKKRLAIDNNKCLDCGSDAECVHHVSYERWKQENIEIDLVSLCNSCHYARHFPTGRLDQ